MRTLYASHDLPRPPRNPNDILLLPHLLLDPIPRLSLDKRHGATKGQSLDPLTHVERAAEEAVEDGREEHGVLWEDSDFLEPGVPTWREEWSEFEG